MRPPLTLACLFALAAVAPPARADVEGRVHAHDGRPLGGASVVAYRLETLEARTLRWSAGAPRPPIASAATAADGAFRVATKAGPVVVEVRAPGFAPWAEVLENGATLAAALKAAPPRRGLVRAGGKPVAGARLVWLSRSEASEHWFGGDALSPPAELVVTSGSDGSYELPDPDVWSGHALILHPDFAPGPIARLPTSRWPEPLVHELDPGVTIEGRAHVGERPGPAGARILVDGFPLARSVALGAFKIPHAPKAWTVIKAQAEGLVGMARPSARGIVSVALQPARRLSGFVRDERTGLPIPGALVLVAADEETATALSDERGLYSFRHLPEARYIPWVVRAGYSGDPEPFSERHRLDLRAALTAERDFVLKRVERVAGRVEDEGGRPVDGATVSVAGRGTPAIYAETALAQVAVGQARSRPDGSFVVDLNRKELLGDNQDAALAVLAVKPGLAAGRAAWDPAAPAPVRIVLGAGVPLEGRVVTESGTPIAGAAIALAESGAVELGRPVPVTYVLQRVGDEGWVRTDADGRFATRAEPGRHHLVASRTGYLPEIVPNVDTRAGVAPEVVLRAAAVIQGVVLRSDGTPASGLVVSALHASAPIATTEPDGRFTLEGIEAGTVAVVVGNETGDPLLTQTLDAPAYDVRLQLEPTGAIRGRVLDSRTREPVTRFTLGLELLPSAKRVGAPGDGSRSTQVADEGGAFLWADAPVGEATLTVEAEEYLPARIEAVSIPANVPTREIEVLLEPGSTLRGRVTTAEGTPLSDAQVAILDAESGRSAAVTDGAGEFELTGLRPGPARLAVQHDGYLSAERAVVVGDPARAEVALSQGLVVTGFVSLGGAGVPNAQVSASSSAPGAESQSTQTGDDGVFSLGGLVPGRYRVEAQTSEADVALEDVDPETAGPLRLALEPRPTAVLRGRVTGLPDAASFVLTVAVSGEKSGNVEGAVDPDGLFHVDRAPAGPVTVRATAMSPEGAMRQSSTRSLVLGAGTTTETEIEFEGTLVVGGTLTRAGAPLPGATISFRNADQHGGVLWARVEANGRYEVAGIEAGRHAISVWGGGVSFETERLITASGPLDIDVRQAVLRGRVRSGASGEPVGGASLTLWEADAEGSRSAGRTTSGTDGSFAFQAVAEGRYRLLAAKAGHGQELRELELVEAGTPELGVDLWPAEGLSLRVVDARDGRPLDASVVVRDMAKRIVSNEHSGVGTDGSLTIALASGRYLLSTSASGYGTLTLPVTAPGSGLQVGLTPGGRLVLESERDLSGRIRLVAPDGEEYVRCWCNGIAEIKVSGHRTALDNITPGTYAVELEDILGGRADLGTVTIEEGRTATLGVP